MCRNKASAHCCVCARLSTPYLAVVCCDVHGCFVAVRLQVLVTHVGTSCMGRICASKLMLCADAVNSNVVQMPTRLQVLVTHGGVEMGQGLHIKMAQVAAHELGVPVNTVFIAETSTDKVGGPPSHFTSAVTISYDTQRG